MNKHAAIRTASELEAAIARTQAARKKKGKIVERELHEWRQGWLKPVRVFSDALSYATPYFAWSGIGLGVARGLRKLLRKSKRK